MKKAHGFITKMFMLLDNAIIRRDVRSCLDIIAVLLNSNITLDDRQYLIELKNDIMNDKTTSL